MFAMEPSLNPNRRSSPRTSVLWRCFFLTLVSAGLASATLVPKMTLEELAEGAQSVVHGKVLRAWSPWDKEQRMIWTHYEIQVADALKGQEEATIVVSEPGGTVGEATMQIAGTPTYDIGEEVVLFTALTPIGYERTCGWGQGKFRVSVSADGTRHIRSPGLSGTQLVPLRAKAVTEGRAQTALQNLDGIALEDFKARLRELIGHRPQ